MRMTNEGMMMLFEAMMEQCYADIEASEKDPDNKNKKALADDARNFIEEMKKKYA